VTVAFSRSLLALALSAGVILRVDLAPGLFCLSVGAPASAATDILSDNLFTATEDVELVAGSRYVSAGFSTDGRSDISLDSITLLMRMDAPGQAQLDLYTDLPGTPGTPDAYIASLVSPAIFPSFLSETVFGGNNLSLAPNTKYWAVLKANSGDFSWAWTRDMLGSGVGFEGTWGFSDTAGAIWDTFDTEAMQMRVTAEAEAVPGPLPLAGAFSALALSRRLRRRIQHAKTHPRR